MKYLAILFLAVSAFANNSFRVTIQTDGYGQKNNTVTSFADARNFGTSNVSSATGDTLSVFSWTKDSGTDTFKVARAYLWSDTLQSAQYQDSMAVASGNYAQIDSIVLTLTGINGVVTGQGCTNQIYAFHFDSCRAAALTNYVAGQAYSLSAFNDIYSAPLASGGVFQMMDSISMIGAGPTIVTFALTNRTELDDIECLMSMSGGNNYCLGFCITSCYDWTNTSPEPQAAYNSKASFYALENAGTDPYLTVYWTEISRSSKWGDKGNWGDWSGW